MIRLFTLGTLLVLSNSVAALELDFPANANLKADTSTASDSHLLAVAPFSNGQVPTALVEGDIQRQVWRIEAAGLTTLQVLTPLKEQLTNAGFTLILECDNVACGGFDFRFGIEVLGAPDMFVDLGDFRFVSAQNAETNEAVSLLVSRTRRAGFVQLIHIGPAGSAPIASTTTAPVRANTTTVPSDFAGELEVNGHVVLNDLTFETGSAQLGDTPFESLQKLADYLAANPSRNVALVGHTDSEGSLDGNIALSKRRAGSVLERLVSDYAVTRSQLAAEGMGFLSPISSNLTPEGRDANRRVEVILTSTE